MQYDSSLLVPYNTSPFSESLSKQRSGVPYRFSVDAVLDEIAIRLKAPVGNACHVGDTTRNHYISMQISGSPRNNILAMISRVDANHPDFHKLPVDHLTLHSDFWSVVCALLTGHSVIPIPHFLFCRRPCRLPFPAPGLLGRTLVVLKLPDTDITLPLNLTIFEHAAIIRAALYSFDPPPGLVSTWLPRLLLSRPEILRHPPMPTRDFCQQLLVAKIHDTMLAIDGNELYSMLVARTKAGLLRILPFVLPPDDGIRYRFVLDISTLGYDNFTFAGVWISSENGGDPVMVERIESLYNADIGLVPALLTSTHVTLDPRFYRTHPLFTSGKLTIDMRQPQEWTNTFLGMIFARAPDFQRAIDRSSGQVRYVWTMLRLIAIAAAASDTSAARKHLNALASWSEQRLWAIENEAGGGVSTEDNGGRKSGVHARGHWRGGPPRGSNGPCPTGGAGAAGTADVGLRSGSGRGRDAGVWPSDTTGSNTNIGSWSTASENSSGTAGGQEPLV